MEPTGNSQVWLNQAKVFSKPMKYAVDCEPIGKAPKIGMSKVEWPEIPPRDFEQYARLLAAARVEGPDWYAAVWLAGEAGWRSGEVRRCAGARTSISSRGRS
jgi:hypothetical protein